MSEKFFQIALVLVETPRSKFFHAAGIAAYVMTVCMWNLVSQEQHLPTLLFFFKALTLILTGYWGAIPFAVLNYRIGKKHGLIVVFFVWLAFSAIAKIFYQQESDTTWSIALNSVTMLSVIGSLLGLALALNTSTIED